MKNKIILLIALLIPIMACSQPKTNMPADWSEFVYHYQTGTVAPQYYYSYDMTVGPAGNVTLVYQPGYQADSTWTYRLTASEDAMIRINQAIKDSDVLTGTIGEAPQEHRPIGGSIQTLTVMLPQDPNLDQIPKRIMVPGFPEEKYKERLKSLYELIQNLVPQTTWKEIESRREIQGEK